MTVISTLQQTQADREATGPLTRPLYKQMMPAAEGDTRTRRQDDISHPPRRHPVPSSTQQTADITSRVPPPVGSAGRASRTRNCTGIWAAGRLLWMRFGMSRWLCAASLVMRLHFGAQCMEWPKNVSLVHRSDITGLYDVRLYCLACRSNFIQLRTE